MTRTEHSPNRKERKARDPAKRWRGNARSNAIETKKKRIVNGVAVGMTRKDAAIAAGMSPDGLTKLLKTHPGLEEKIEKAEEEYRRVAAGVIDDHLKEVAKEVVDISLKGEEERVRLQGGLALLRGRGVLVEKSQQETEGKLEVIIKVLYDENKRGGGSPAHSALPSGEIHR